jgi:hypothetical protein
LLTFRFIGRLLLDALAILRIHEDLTSCVAATAPTATAARVPATYTLIATPVAGSDQAKDTTCASFTVTSAGTQSSLNSGGTDTTSTRWK